MFGALTGPHSPSWLRRPPIKKLLAPRYFRTLLQSSSYKSVCMSNARRGILTLALYPILVCAPILVFAARSGALLPTASSLSSTQCLFLSAEDENFKSSRRLLGNTVFSDDAIATFLALDSAAGSAVATAHANSISKYRVNAGLSEQSYSQFGPRPTLPYQLQTGLRVVSALSGRPFTAERSEAQQAAASAATSAAATASQAQHLLASTGAASDSADIDFTFAAASTENADVDSTSAAASAIIGPTTAAAFAAGSRREGPKNEPGDVKASTACSETTETYGVRTSAAHLGNAARAFLWRLRSAEAAFSRWACPHQAQLQTLLAVGILLALLAGLALVTATCPKWRPPQG